MTPMGLPIRGGSTGGDVSSEGSEPKGNHPNEAVDVPEVLSDAELKRESDKVAFNNAVNPEGAAGAQGDGE